jgi:hypothetical protein
MYWIREPSLRQRLCAEDVTEFVDDLRLRNRHDGQQESTRYHRQSCAQSDRQLLAIREPAQPSLGPAAHAKKIKKIA